MPQFNWNEMYLIEYLGVLPEVDEYEEGHHFTIHRTGLRLVVSIYQHSAEVWFSLFRGESEHQLFSMRLIDCPGVKLVRNPSKPDYLEFPASRAFGDRWMEEPVPLIGVRLWVDPDIKIELI